MNNGLNAFIKILEKEGEIIRIKEFVDPMLEITEVTDRISKSVINNKALLFEETGSRFPLLINSLGSEKRICLAFRRDSLDGLESELENLFQKLLSPKKSLWDKLKMLSHLKEFSRWMPVKSGFRGKCQQVVHKEPDLGIFPVMKCWPADGGRFVTLPVVHTVDPETGIPNAGMYRMQVFGKSLTGMHWHRHKTGAAHYLKYRNLGKIMPVSVTLGGDPVYTYAATAPMPENMDEYMLAGFLRRHPVKLVKCLTNDLYVPEDADIVIEGYIDPSEDLIKEGPFGDHTGFYSLADNYPRFHVTCITHREDAVYPATIVGIPPMEDAWIGKATERIFLTPMRLSIIPEIADLDLPFSGVAHNIAIVKIRKNYPGQAVKVMHSLWGAGQMMFNKFLIISDGDIDIHDYKSLAAEGFKRFKPGYCLHFAKGPLDILDHSSSFFAYGSKVGIDLTSPLEGELEGEKQPDHIPDSSDSEAGELNLPFVRGIEDLSKKLQIPVIILSVEKSNNYRKEKLVEKLRTDYPNKGTKLFLLLDCGTDLTDLFTLVWLTGSNVDPSRDISVIESGTSSFALIDATMKIHPYDRFPREWPNLVISDQETIRSVDSKWEKLGLGKLIPSPSLKFGNMVKNEGAVSSVPTADL